MRACSHRFASHEEKTQWQFVSFPTAPPTGSRSGSPASDKVSLYGVAPVAQRAGAAQATSLVGTASSTAVNTDLKAAVIEIMNTLTALGSVEGLGVGRSDSRRAGAIRRAGEPL